MCIGAAPFTRAASSRQSRVRLAYPGYAADSMSCLSPSPRVGEGLGRGGGEMNTRQFAKALRQNMTDAECLLWRHLRAHRLDSHKFRRQQPIGPYIVDFVHFGARIIVEADGGQHAEDSNDVVRDTWLGMQGFCVLRFWNHDILQRTDAVLDAIWMAVSAAAPAAPLSPGPSPARVEGRSPTLK